MFDGELPGGECELLARRLTRDEALRAQWSRYSMIGAALRAERGVALHDRVARKVQSVIALEVSYGQDADVTAASDASRSLSSTTGSSSSRQRWSRFALPMAGAGLAASVAVSLFWLRGVQEPEELQADAGATTSIVLTPDPGESTTVALAAPAATAETAEPGAYVVPPSGTTPGIAPPARLANYVVAHSEYSGPLSRRMALLGLVGADGDSTAAPEAAPADAAAAEDQDAP
jgi:negative regulator of sigma E activity